jgi:Fe2+ transport system protein A
LKKQIVSVEEKAMFPLALARKGEKLIIRKIKAGHEIKTRFKELGFCEGAQITIALAERGNLIVRTKDSSYAIDKDFAQNVYVS